MNRIFVPNQYVASLRDVDPRSLMEVGIRGVLLDLDNTLVSWRRSDLDPNMEEWVARAIEAGLKLCIVSNTWRRSRIQNIADQLHIPYILRAGKPRRGSLTRALEMVGTAPAETAVIGDQLFTDVVGGNRIGAYTILCVPMPGQEFFGTSIVRNFEKFLMKKLATKGMLSLPDESSEGK